MSLISELQLLGRNTGWKARLLAKKPFWPAWWQAVLVGAVIAVASYFVAWLFGSPWLELLSFASVMLYLVVLSRLNHGRGHLLRRIARVLAWGLLLGLCIGVMDWMLLSLVPVPIRFLGVRVNSSSTFHEHLLNSLFMIFSLLLPMRVLQTLWLLGRSRLRWQLTFSYLLIGLLATIFFPFLMSLFIGILSFGPAPRMISAQDAAQRTASAIAPLVHINASGEQLSRVMQGMLDGSVQLPTPPGQVAEGLASFSVEQVRLVRFDNGAMSVIGSHSSTPQQLSEAEKAQLEATLTRLPQGGCLMLYADDGPLRSNTVCSFHDRANQPSVAVLIQSAAESTMQATTPPSFDGVRRMLLLHPDGTVLAGAGKDVPTRGAPLPSSESIRLSLLMANVRAGGCIGGRPSDGPLIDSAACAILDAQGNPRAILLVETAISGTDQISAEFIRIVSLVLVGTNITLGLVLAATVVILMFGLGVGHILARRLTRRIEMLTEAATNIAAGNMERRVEVDSDDEVGRLSADFNTMAIRLAERERALAATAARAEELLRANRQLVADISHELRTPLATLRGYLEVLEQEYGDKLPAHDMAVIQGEVKRLTRLIDELFTLARAEAHQLPLQMEIVDAGAVARHLAQTLAPLAQRERKIEIVTALPTDLPPVWADRTRLEQVLLNLAHNALRYTPNGGIVALEGAAANGCITLTVADTGTGIPLDELPHIFERFYRGDSSRTRETGGAGLGLALVKELTEAMGGTVTVESVPGRGSRFSVTLRRGDL